MKDPSDDIFKALADPHRRRIVSALCEQPQVAGALARLTGLAPNALSFHLRWLRTAGLVSIQREGRFIRYAAEPATIRRWKEQVSLLFSERKRASPGPETSPKPIRVRRRRVSAPLPEAAPPPESFEEVLPTELL